MDEQGRKRVAGGGALKASQAYPVDFGRHVAKVYKANMDLPVCSGTWFDGWT